MLVELHIKDFAIIDELTVTFSNGLNILSGETGAGKSIIINAVNLILGDRAQSDLIRTGSEEAVVEAMFSLPIVESPLGEEVFSEAVDLYRNARRTGLTVRSSVDCLIAACAMRHDLEVLHRNRDYPVIAKVSALRHRLP